MQQRDKRQRARPAGKLVRFSSGVISQEDLCEEYLLRQELRRAKELHRRQRARIREQLTLGATSLGPRCARLVERFRRKEGGQIAYTVLLID